GVVACCINKEDAEFNETFSKATDPQEIESFLISSFRKLRRKDFSFLSFVSPQIDPSTYLRGVKMSLGKFFKLSGGGFLKKYSSYNSQIVNNTSGEGLINIAIKGLQINSLKIGGYTPLGKPFVITKTTTNGDIIMEINNQPAINIYRHYLEEKFKIFMKNRLFSFYPLGIHTNGSFKLLNVVNCLEDGSLTCVERIKEGDSGYIMFLDSTLSLKNLEDKLTPLRNDGQELTFIINSLSRKNILGTASGKEIALIKNTLGDKSKMIGLYTDYSLFSNREKGSVDIETGNLLITMWK
ncbi:MAG: FIST C-terminal domain-containing protein, partial [Candidatus Omnitrophica bacterium]|nr:FIST C-terminal domain-containing protein [Candidatus Omnitrophota bacterium]